MPFSFGPRSLGNLKGVHPDLVKVATRAIELSTQDFMVLEGVRTKARQAELWAQGRTKPGPKVTWTMNSNHFVKADGFGHAIDTAAFPYDGETVSKYKAIASAMFAAAKELGVAMRYGGDWDRDGRWFEPGESDIGHFELAT